MRSLIEATHQTMASEFGKQQSLKSPMQQRKQQSQISGLLVAAMANSSTPDDQDDITGKKSILIIYLNNLV